MSARFVPKALEQARKLWELFFLRCGAMFEEPLVRGHEDKLSPVFRDFLARAHAAGPLTAEELLTAWAEADIIRHKLLVQMQEFPLLLCPVASVPAFRHGERSWTIDGQASRVPRRHALYAVVQSAGCARGGRSRRTDRRRDYPSACNWSAVRSKTKSC